MLSGNPIELKMIDSAWLATEGLGDPAFSDHEETLDPFTTTLGVHPGVFQLSGRFHEQVTRIDTALSSAISFRHRQERVDQPSTMDFSS